MSSLQKMENALLWDIWDWGWNTWSLFWKFSKSIVLPAFPRHGLHEGKWGRRETELKFGRNTLVVVSCLMWLHLGLAARRNSASWHPTVSQGMWSIPRPWRTDARHQHTQILTFLKFFTIANSVLKQKMTKNWMKIAIFKSIFAILSFRRSRCHHQRKENVPLDVQQRLLRETNSNEPQHLKMGKKVDSGRIGSEMHRQF